MLPYYFKLSHRLILEHEKTFVSDIALKRLDKFFMHNTKKYGSSGNNILWKQDIEDINVINYVKNNTLLPHWALIIMHTPNAHVTRHRDIPNDRDTILTIPIYPSENYAPTLYFRDSAQIEPEAICNHSDKMPSFMNTNEPHEVRNGDTYRLNIQLCFKQNIYEIVEIYNQGKLFSEEILNR